MFDGDIIDINKADLNWPSQIMKIQPIDFQWQMEDPFIFCAHHNDDYPKGNADQAITVPLRGRNVGSDFSGKDGWSMYHGETVPVFRLTRTADLKRLLLYLKEWLIITIQKEHADDMPTVMCSGLLPGRGVSIRRCSRW